MFQYNNVYYYRYVPVTLGTIHIYDQFPLVIPLEIKGQIMLACNLHWIPGVLRRKFVQVIVDMKRKCINQSMFHLWYRTIKYQPPLQFALQAVRKYYMSRCTNVKLIDQNHWDMLTVVSGSLYKARYLQRSKHDVTRHILRDNRR
jgi:hypothetical protein